MASTSYSSDDEAPEALTFNSQKKVAKGQEVAIEQHRLAEKRKLKEKNRNRDKALKERSVQNTGRAPKRRKVQVEREAEEEGPEGSEQEDEETRRLKERMKRAMEDAEEESDEEAEGEESRSLGRDDDDELEGEEDKDEDGPSGDEEDDGEELEEHSEQSDDDDSEDEEEETTTVARRPQRNPDYLPDDLFESAFSQKPSPSLVSTQPSSGSSSKKKARQQATKKRKRSNTKNKDIVVGSRTIRTLSSSTSETSATLRPTRGVNTFLKRNLNANGNSTFAKAKGWNRKAANIGVMRTSGPAANFVRDS